MQIVIDKSYLQGVSSEIVHRLCEEHTVLFLETLLYELLTATESERNLCFGKFPETDNPVMLIPRPGPLLRYENKHLRAASPLIDHRIPVTFRFNPQLVSGCFQHAPNEQTALTKWRQQVMHEVETFHDIATGVSAWCPRLLTVRGEALRSACEDLKRQASTDADVVRGVYRSLELEGFASSSLLDPSWVLFRWIQAHLLFALDYIARYGFADLGKTPKRIENDIHDIQYVLFGCLCGALATRDSDIRRNFQLARPEGRVLF